MGLNNCVPCVQGSDFLWAVDSPHCSIQKRLSYILGITSGLLNKFVLSVSQAAKVVLKYLTCPACNVFILCLDAVFSFVSSKMGRRYVEPPSFNLKASYDDSRPSAPLVFVLSLGADPVPELFKLAGVLLNGAFKIDVRWTSFRCGIREILKVDTGLCLVR